MKEKIKNMSGGRRNLWHVAIFFYICIIYGNSLTPAGISSKESGYILGMLRQTFEACGVDHWRLTEHVVRKTAHFVEYAGLGFLLAQAGRLWLRPVGEWLPSTLLWIFFVPFVDETIQLFVTGRSGQISDVWLDMCGAACGLIVTTGVMAILYRKNNGRWNA